MKLGCVIAALILSVTSTALADHAVRPTGKVSTCDAFKARFANAGRMLALPMPVARYELAKGNDSNTDIWYINNLNGHAAKLECSKAGGLRKFQVDVFTDTERPLATVTIIAAAIQAYTDEPLTRVLVERDLLMDKASREASRANGQGDGLWEAEIKLPNGTARLLGGEGLTFELLAGSD
jgi:hypothetical protein